MSIFINDKMNMEQRANYARYLHNTFNKKIHICPDKEKWVYSEKFNRWYAFSGRYSNIDPEEKIKKYKDRIYKRFKYRHSIKNKLECVAYYNLHNKLEEKYDIKKYQAGVYFIYNSEKEIIYIGKSKNLKKRILSSCRDKSGVYIRFGKTENEIDATIYEAYYIGKHKPKLNSDLIDSEASTLDLEELSLSEFIPLYSEFAYKIVKNN